MIMSKRERDDYMRRAALEQTKRELLEGWADPAGRAPHVGADFPCQPLKRKAVSKLGARNDVATIVALDPGGTTGWSLMRWDLEALSKGSYSTPELIHFGLKEWKHGQIDCGTKAGNLGTSLDAGISTSGEFAGARTIGGLLRREPEAVVVIENFILREFNKGKDLLSPERLKAIIGYELWLNQRIYFTQTPSEKELFKNERLIQLGMYERAGGMEHARDADRHALLFATRCAEGTRKSRELREAAWPQFFGAGK